MHASTTDLVTVDGYAASIRPFPEFIDVESRARALEPYPSISPLKRLRSMPAQHQSPETAALSSHNARINARIDADAARLKQLLAVDKAE